MGERGAKNTAAAEIIVKSLLDDLQEIDGLSSKKMFGGFGLFHADKMFGIVDSQGTPFLKINKELQSDFEDRGGHQHSRMPYYSIPEDILHKKENLLEWARRSISISK
jgi:DNA transformation protein